MWIITRIRGPLIMALLPFKNYVKPVRDPEETPMDRVKKLFVSTQYEPVSKELLTLKSMTATAALLGTIVGGILHTRQTVEQFINNNQGTLFRSQFDAERQLQNTFAVQFIKGGFKFGWRVTVFTAVFGFIQLLLTTYYGEPSVLHYMIGAGTAGFLFKLSLGLKGSLVGLVVGSILGGIGGFITLFTLKLAGLSLDDLNNIGQQWAHEKDEAYKEAVAKNLSDDLTEAKSLYDINQEMRKKLSVEEEKAKT